MPKFRFTDTLREARRRRVFRAAGLYIVGAWILLQVADMAFPALGVPEASIRFVWIGVIIGFPIALVFGWLYEFSDGRIMRTRSAGSEIEQFLQRTDYVILAALVGVAVLIATGLVGEISETQDPVAEPMLIDAIHPASIAVLPFVNMSPDPDNSYFADGISEEILNGLARVSGLRVTARTSSFSLRGERLNARQIGQRLNVAFVLEGSVRVAGDTVRVTAQLIDSRQDIHRWSDTYDRPKNEILAVQDEVAQKVVSLLATELTEEILASSISTTRDTEAYILYLRGKSLLRAKPLLEIEELNTVVDLLEQATSRDPQFADAYVGLAEAYLAIESMNLSPMPVNKEVASKARKLALEKADAAIAIRGDSSEAFRIKAVISIDDAEKQELLRRAITANPNNADAYVALGALLAEHGSVEEGSRLIRLGHSIDPLDPNKIEYIAQLYKVEGDFRKAADFFQLIGSMGDHEVSEEYKKRIRRLNEALPLSPRNLGFEASKESWVSNPNCEDDYEFSISSDSYSGFYSGHLKSLSDSGGWCQVLQALRADQVRDKYLRLRVMVKSRNISQFATIWITVWDQGARSIAFSDTWPNHIRNLPNWVEYAVRVYVPPEGSRITFGTVLNNQGEVWIDDIRLEVSSSSNFEILEKPSNSL